MTPCSSTSTRPPASAYAFKTSPRRSARSPAVRPSWTNSASWPTPPGSPTASRSAGATPSLGSSPERQLRVRGRGQGPRAERGPRTLDVPAPLLEQADAIKALHLRLGGQQKDRTSATARRRVRPVRGRGPRDPPRPRPRPAVEAGTTSKLSASRPPTVAAVHDLANDARPCLQARDEAAKALQAHDAKHKPSPPGSPRSAPRATRPLAQGRQEGPGTGRP